MAISKVVFGNTTLIDITSTTATASTILSGYGCYGADGQWINGTINASAVDYILACVALDGFDYATDYSSATTALGGE